MTTCQIPNCQASIEPWQAFFNPLYCMDCRDGLAARQNARELLAPMPNGLLKRFCSWLFV